MKLINAVNKNDTELVNELISKGYDINEKDDYGWTALILASYHGYLEITKELIKAGASLDEKNLNRCTALIYATDWNYKKIVIELIKAGASLDVKNKYEVPEICQNMENSIPLTHSRL